jgi:hypothetical protein
VRLRSLRNSNIVLSGIPISQTSDVDSVTNILHDELHINAVVTKCVRLGKPGLPGARPQMLLATLADEKHVTEALHSARMLRLSTSTVIRENVYLNADLTPQQRTTLYNSRMELKRRRAAGEFNLVIRDGCVVSKPNQRLGQPTASIVTSST